MSWSAHLTKGLKLLGEQWTTGPRRWVAAGENPFDTAVRAAMVGGVGYILWRLLSSSWAVLAAVVLVVVIAALRTATKAAKGTLKPSAKASPSAPPAAPDEPEEDFFVALVWDVLGGSPAVHLTTLARHLAEATGQEWTPDRVRAACRTLSIPVRPKVRDLGGDRVSSGLHRDDLPPLPQPLPEGASEPVGAATPQVTAATPHGNATAPTRTVRRVGDLRITAVDDPNNPARTHVRVSDPTRKRAG
jgi:hypothetical protein